MRTTIWTVTVRAIAVLTAVLAVATIIISLKATGAQAGPPDGAKDQPIAASDPAADAEGQALQPVLATRQTEQASVVSEQASETHQAATSARYAAPSEALPATRARSVAGQSNVSERPRVTLPANRRLVAVLDVGSTAPADVLDMAQLVKQGLESKGYDVSLLEGDTASAAGPLRPDAYVSIRTVPSTDAVTGVEAWFCQVQGALGGQLTDLLLRSLAAAGVPDVGQGDAEITNPDDFDCSLLLAGRARMPAVLLEIPALDGEGDQQALTQGLANGIHQFFQKYRNSLLREDQRQRLVWPALGPITSQFGPDHPLGIDIGQSDGPVVAATDGVVIFAGGDPCCSYGLYAVIQSPDGIATLYAHLDSISVTQGQSVRQGQPLGIVGCTGHCSGTHLHFEVIQDGVRRDPLSYLQ
jgi:murein DD-endopeptidase MepM/ murein hydrolase activator NlpD